MYATHASAAFNSRLGNTLRRLGDEIATALGANFVALVLGGGYGRGEGGVVLRDGVEQPYNDLDLVIVVRRKLTFPRDTLRKICDQYQQRLGIHVDLSRPLTTRNIRHWPHTLMWQDLLRGHAVINGPAHVLRDNAPRHLSCPLPGIEALRLLLNRGAGLLWAMRVDGAVEPAPDGDFIRRNYYKCALALGDALLIGYQRFVTSYAQREQAFTELCREQGSVDELGLKLLYSRALAFKFRPDSVDNATPTEAALAELAERWGEVLLHVESKRTGALWTSLRSYAAWKGPREVYFNRPLQWPANWIRNRRLAQWSGQHPREQLYRSLPQLLAAPRGSDWAAASARWLDIWRAFN